MTDSSLLDGRFEAGWFPFEEGWKAGMRQYLNELRKYTVIVAFNLIFLLILYILIVKWHPHSTPILVLLVSLCECAHGYVILMVSTVQSLSERLRIAHIRTLGFELPNTPIATKTPPPLIPQLSISSGSSLALSKELVESIARAYRGEETFQRAVEICLSILREDLTNAETRVSALTAAQQRVFLSYLMVLDHILRKVLQHSFDVVSTQATDVRGTEGAVEALVEALQEMREQLHKVLEAGIER